MAPQRARRPVSEDTRPVRGENPEFLHTVTTTRRNFERQFSPVRRPCGCGSSSVSRVAAGLSSPPRQSSGSGVLNKKPNLAQPTHGGPRQCADSRQHYDSFSPDYLSQPIAMVDQGQHDADMPTAMAFYTWAATSRSIVRRSLAAPSSFFFGCFDRHAPTPAACGS